MRLKILVFVFMSLITDVVNSKNGKNVQSKIQMPVVQTEKLPYTDRHLSSSEEPDLDACYEVNLSEGQRTYSSHIGAYNRSRLDSLSEGSWMPTTNLNQWMELAVPSATQWLVGGVVIQGSGDPCCRANFVRSFQVFVEEVFLDRF